MKLKYNFFFVFSVLTNIQFVLQIDSTKIISEDNERSLQVDESVSNFRKKTLISSILSNNNINQLSIPNTESTGYDSIAVENIINTNQDSIINNPDPKPSNTNANINTNTITTTDIAEISVSPTVGLNTKVYQSGTLNNRDLKITGSGFKNGISLELDPPLRVGIDYFCQVVHKNFIQLLLKNGKKWRSTPGYLTVKSIKMNKKVYPINNANSTNGIIIASVFADPSIMVGNNSYQESKNNLIIIKGRGFTNTTEIVIRPTLAEAYDTTIINDHMILLQLKPECSWLPGFLSLTNNDNNKDTIPIQITDINTGAGPITYKTPVTIGFIVKDEVSQSNDNIISFSPSILGSSSSSSYGSISDTIRLFLIIFFMCACFVLLLYIYIKMNYSGNSGRNSSGTRSGKKEVNMYTRMKTKTSIST